MGRRKTAAVLTAATTLLVLAVLGMLAALDYGTAPLRCLREQRCEVTR